MSESIKMVPYAYDTLYARQMYNQLQLGDLLVRNNIFYGRLDTNPHYYDLPLCAIVTDVKLHDAMPKLHHDDPYFECVHKIAGVPFSSTCTCSGCHRRFVNTSITAVGRNDNDDDVIHEFYAGMLGYYIVGKEEML